MQKENFLNRLQKKWGLDSLWQVLIILVVFAITGSTIVFLKPFVFAWLGIGDATAPWVKTLLYLIFMLPAYQAFLLFYGFLFGQFSFFWEKEKKLFALIKKPFQKKHNQ